MKYALTGPRGAIFQILDTAPVGQDSTEITNAQAAEAEAIRADKDIPFLINGAVTSRKIQREAGNQMRWNEETSQFEITVIVIPPEQQIRNLWAGLTADEKAGVYTYAPAAILAWERGEMEVMVKLILTNTSPEIADLKTAIEAILNA